MEFVFIDDMERLFDCEIINEDIIGLLFEDIKLWVVVIKEMFFVVFLFFESVFRKIRFLEIEILEDIGKRGIEKLYIFNEFVKVVFVLFYVVFVGVYFGFFCNIGWKYLDEMDGFVGFIVICKVLNVLGKKVICIVSFY